MCQLRHSFDGKCRMVLEKKCSSVSYILSRQACDGDEQAADRATGEKWRREGKKISAENLKKRWITRK